MVHVYWLGLLTCILFGVISVIKMVLHSERIILLSMFYKAYLNVFFLFLLQYKGIIIVSWIDYNSLLSLSSPSKVWIWHTNPITNYHCSRQLRFWLECVSVQSVCAFAVRITVWNRFSQDEAHLNSLQFLIWLGSSCHTYGQLEHVRSRLTFLSCLMGHHNCAV